MKRKLLLCGGTGFIGRNLLERFLEGGDYEIFVPWHRRRPPAALRGSRARFFRADLTQARDVERAVKGMAIVVLAAAKTSGAKDIVSRPFEHVTDNAVMNSLILRSCHRQKVGQVVFLSCSVMYPSRKTPAKETDFDHSISEKYFGVGWTKVYGEKLCEFYARLGPGKFLAIRHSNVYGPHDKYDLEKSHVFGATVAKVLSAKNGRIVVWGDGSERRDLLYVGDLARFVALALSRQEKPFDVVNVGSGRSVSVAELARRIIRASGRRLEIEFDRDKPTIGHSLCLDISRAKSRYGWAPQVSLDEGIKKTLEWYRRRFSNKVHFR